MTQALEGHFNPAVHFLGLLQKTIADGITRHCVHPGCPDVYLVPAEHAYYSAHPDIEALHALCLAAPFDLDVESVPDWHPNSDQDLRAGRMLIHRKQPSTNTELLKRPLDELLWYATLCASNGQLLQGHYAETTVRLLSCPDFSRLYHKAQHPLLATALLENSATLTQVAETTGIPLAQVIDFHNACAILGLIVVEESHVFEPEKYLPGLIQKSANDPQMWRCELAGQALLIISPAEGKYYSDADPTAMAKLCTAPLSELQVSAVENNSDEEEIVQIGRTRVRRKKAAALPKMAEHPLSELRFRAALYASQGRLLAGYDMNATVHLHSWPDKKLLKESASIKTERYIFPLAAYMTGKTAKLAEIAEATGLPLAQVIDFHNACALAGLLEQR
ncbi:MAG: hypothetical protein Q7U57_19600 [Methylovulum sp.]|nr:hypothetical protein [Methylovulum sp.]